MAAIAISLPLIEAFTLFDSFNWTLAFLVLAIVCGVILESFFSIALYFISGIKITIIQLEEEQNTKFQAMFNAIQDAVVVVKGGSLKFMNLYGVKLIGDTTNHIDTPFLFLMNDVEEKDLKQTRSKEGEKLSLRDILAIEEDTLAQCVFTTSAEIASCKQMDQVQRIIKE